MLHDAESRVVVGGLGVGALERLATALLVTEECPAATVDERAERLAEYKPHVSFDAARRAMVQIEEMAERAAGVRVR
jgi:hypothetical protein